MPASSISTQVPAASYLIFSSTCNNTNYTASPLDFPQSAPVPHHFSPEPLRICTCVPNPSSSIPEPSDSAPLPSPTAPIPLHFSPQPHRFRTGCPICCPKALRFPPTPSTTPPLPHRFLSNCSTSAPLFRRTAPNLHLFPKPLPLPPQSPPVPHQFHPKPLRFCTTFSQNTPQTKTPTNSLTSERSPPGHAKGPVIPRASNKCLKHMFLFIQLPIRLPNLIT
jgi:hypothetical protein